mmetsp:Transcript_262/g.116  ORF Transcript_262/g.116 Transcript_262/m.116 type:complete len:546 (-) Transcript_262:3607-5244(-)
MKKVFGNTGGLKANQIKRLQNLYRRRILPEFIVTFEVAREITKLSYEINRQIGLLINRRGKTVYVIAGNNQGILIPDTSAYRVAPGRLRGLRCIHTHLKNEPLTSDDISDLALLRLDIMAAITIKANGQPHQVHVSHILPTGSDKKPYQILKPINPDQMNIGCLDLIHALEVELSQIKSLYDADTEKERAFLVSITTESIGKAKESLAELEDLALSCGINVVETIIQYRKKTDSRLLIGRGKLKDLNIIALQKGVTLLVFDQELNPSQIRSITGQTDLKVIDRTQLILDIFAQRAKSSEGKLQVELAQLKYMLPRLIEKNTTMSRLTGGIGGRGPGETKLEINRRRVRDRIKRIENRLSIVKKRWRQQKARRNKRGLPVISIIGYTNTGKSTLLNTLTKSNVLAEKRLFATLDPSSRRLKFPKNIEVIITDTVGFIKDLPKELIVAFRSTLEELESADLLLHVIDISNPRFKNQIESVEKILKGLNLGHIQTIRILNKQDLVDTETVRKLCMVNNGTAISANNESTLMPLIEKMESLMQRIKRYA